MDELHNRYLLPKGVKVRNSADTHAHDATKLQARRSSTWSGPVRFRQSTEVIIEVVTRVVQHSRQVWQPGRM